MFFDGDIYPHPKLPPISYPLLLWRFFDTMLPVVCPASRGSPNKRRQRSVQNGFEYDCLWPAGVAISEGVNYRFMLHSSVFTAAEFTIQALDAEFHNYLSHFTPLPFIIHRVYILNALLIDAPTCATDNRFNTSSCSKAAVGWLAGTSYLFDPVSAAPVGLTC